MLRFGVFEYLLWGMRMNFHQALKHSDLKSLKWQNWWIKIYHLYCLPPSAYIESLFRGPGCKLWTICSHFNLSNYFLGGILQGWCQRQLNLFSWNTLLHRRPHLGFQSFFWKGSIVHDRWIPFAVTCWSTRLCPNRCCALHCCWRWWVSRKCLEPIFWCSANSKFQGPAYVFLR